MELEEFLRLSRRLHNGLGSSVVGQLEAAIEGAELEELNPNALRLIAEWLREAERSEVEGAEPLAEEIAAHLAEL